MEQVLSYTSKDLTKKTFAVQSILENLMADIFLMSAALFKEKTNTAIDRVMKRKKFIKQLGGVSTLVMVSGLTLSPFVGKQQHHIAILHKWYAQLYITF